MHEHENEKHTFCICVLTTFKSTFRYLACFISHLYTVLILFYIQVP